MNEQSPHEVKHEPIQPKDVITSSGTIVGLILTALGILIALAGDKYQSVAKNFWEN